MVFMSSANDVIRSRITELTNRKFEIEHEIHHTLEEIIRAKDNTMMIKYLKDRLEIDKKKIAKLNPILEQNQSLLMSLDDEYKYQLEN